MSRVGFEIGYDGASIEDGTMDVSDLAPALQAVGRLLKHSNSRLNQDLADVEIRVRAGVQQGSFPIELVLDLNLAEQLDVGMAYSKVVDAHQLLTLLGFLDPEAKTVTTIQSLIDLFKVLRGRQPASQEVLEDENIKLEVPGEGNEIIVNRNTFNLYGDISVRKDLEDVMKPVRLGRAEEFQVRRQGEVTRRVGEEEAGYFAASTDEEEEVEEGEEVKWVTVRKHWYRDDRKWKFYDGATSFSAMVKDDEFWERVHKDEIQFSEHAQFKVRVRWRQIRTPDKVSMQRTVVEVLDYRPAAVQGDLRLPNEGPGEDSG